MPIYEFKCPECEKVVEVFQHSTTQKEEICECGAVMKWKPSGFGFTFDFKSGWDMGLGEYVDTKKQRDDFVREKGLVRKK